MGSATPVTNRRAWLAVGVLALLVAAVPAVAAPSTGEGLDRSFGDDGVSVTATHLGTRGEAGLAVAEDHRGRLIVAGASEGEAMLVRRFGRDGEPDRFYGHEGWVEASAGEAGRAVAILPGGGVLVAGQREGAFALVRLGRDGNRARSFGEDGHVVTSAGFDAGGALALGIQPGGRIVAAGYGVDIQGRWRGLVFGYRPDGSLDTGFGTEGKVAFSAPGKAEVVITGLVVMPTGKLLLGGVRDGRLLLARLRPDGRPDRGFGGGDGVVEVDADGGRGCPCSFSHALALAPGGRPLMAGETTGPRSHAGLLVRFLPDGRLDPSFGNGGVVRIARGERTVFNGLAVGPAGATAAGFSNSSRTGEAQVLIARVRPDGELDPDFGADGVLRLHFGRESVASAAITERDGKALVAGRALFGKTAFEAPSPLEGSEVLMVRLKR
jgi:uncharacterized delta-60 repeat protein